MDVVLHWTSNPDLFTIANVYEHQTLRLLKESTTNQESIDSSCQKLEEDDDVIFICEFPLIVLSDSDDDDDDIIEIMPANDNNSKRSREDSCHESLPDIDMSIQPSKKQLWNIVEKEFLQREAQHAWQISSDEEYLDEYFDDEASMSTD